jgi:serine/threonine-protein kinase
MITHERWQRIKEIFHSAQIRTADRSEFLNEVCGDDALLREEVETLLAADDANENFLTSPAYEFAAGMLASETTEFVAGQTVGRYEILCPLGAGGMGQIAGIRHRSAPCSSFRTRSTRRLRSQPSQRMRDP